MKKILLSVLAGVATLFGCTGGAQKAGSGADAPDTTSVNHPEWSRNAVIYEVNTRQYTPEGTFKAFAEHLPRLKDLGVDILWFMPIHPISEANRKGTLGSYYAVRDYKGVNPEFGDLADFKALVDSAHANGMKVIIDWVPNHTGCDNPWVAEHPDRYARNEQGEMYGPADWTDVYQLDYSNPDTRAAMIDAMQYWLREADIDGFRCDVAGMVPVDFWNEARPALESVKPDIFMLAEAAMPSLHEEAFDMGYNWPMVDLFNRISAYSGQNAIKNASLAEGETAPKFTADDIDSLLADQAANYPVGSIMMNMVTNHDYNSWDGTEFQRYGNLTPAFAVLSYTLPGMPLIYTGQETGMDHAFEFFEKDNAPQWEPRNEYFVFYKTLNNLKHKRHELNAGSVHETMTVYPTESEDLFVFSRQADGCKTVVGVNLGKETAELKFKDTPASVKGFNDLMNATAVEDYPAALAPGEYFIYVN